MRQVAECVAATVGAGAYMWAFQWRHYFGRGRYARRPKD